MRIEPLFGQGVLAPAPHSLPLGRIAAFLALFTLTLAGARPLHDIVQETLRAPLPSVSGVAIADVLWDNTPVTLTLWTPQGGVPFVATRDQILRDASLWQRMHLSDWNHVPEDLRRTGLDAVLLHYWDILSSPSAWDRMTAHDWDRIPQPVRVVAYRRMVEYWSGFYGVGDGRGLPSWLVAQTLAAIVMSESWFDHRAQNVGFNGQRDYGLSQASEQARERLRDLHAQGLVDVHLADEDYFNPWMATRFVAIWMKQLLDDVDGDLETAVRAYNRGVSRAYDELGTTYVTTVESRLHRYIQNRDGSPAWSHVWHRSRAIPWRR